MKAPTMMSLFSGSGGFELAATLCGITPIYGSEVEPYPIAVTCSRFPQMKHLGDVSKINGATIIPVDLITFGSPCQDLSVAGKRKGLKHEENGDEETTRSGLFMEAIRIIKEMREATNGKYPRFALWENVPGAFSSNKGEDFRIVLEEFIKVKEPTATMPAVPKGGWAYADCIVGDRWSVAYRTLDAQYWGVPQRRRRIYLVADFADECAGKILFKRKSLRRYTAQSGSQRKDPAADAEESAGTDDRTTVKILNPWDVQSKHVHDPNGIASPLYAGECRGGGGESYVMQPSEKCVYPEKAGTLCASGYSKLGTQEAANGLFPVIEQIPSEHTYSVENHPNDSRVSIDDSGKVQTLTSRMGTGGGNVPMVMHPQGINGDVAATIDASYYKGCGMRQGIEREVIAEPIACIDGDKIGKAERSGGSGLGIREGDTMYTLTAKDAGNHAVCYPINDKATRYKGGGPSRNEDGAGNGLGVGEDGDPSPTLTAGDRHGVCYGIDRAAFNQGKNAQFGFSVLEELQPTMTAKGPGAVCLPQQGEEDK